MNSSLPRLADLTAQLADMQNIDAAFTITILKSAFGSSVCGDPDLLDQFLAGRGVTGPVKTLIKGAVAALDSTSALNPTRPMLSAFFAAVDRVSVLGQLGAVKVPSANLVGASLTTAPVVSWVGENVVKPVASMAFAATSLKPLKAVVDVPVSEELLRLGAALGVIERVTVSAVAAALDVALLDPANAGTTDVKPASLTNGLVAVVAALDLQNQVGQVLNAISSGAPARPVLIVSLQTALRLSALPGLTDYVKVLVTPAAGGRLIAVDTDAIAYADDGGVLKIGEPTIQMDSAPTSPAVAATVMRSAWQENLKVVRAERWVNWTKRTDAVAYLTLA
jgi:hypothetical protein